MTLAAIPGPVDSPDLAPPARPSEPQLDRVHSAVLEWYAANGRDLAFRRTTDPWAILVSEVMAQQTQAARAAEHWARFMAQFPTPAALAAASPATVIRAWRGLGYNRRAVALRAAAARIVEEHDGHVPNSLEALLALPGVGPYTARAILAFAFGLPVAPVDTNVRRVLDRAVRPLPVGALALQASADRFVPPAAAAWSHALMDLGATICRPREPLCEACPIRPWCRTASGRSAPAEVGTSEPRARNAPGPAFQSTTRWLRGRILDQLRDAPDGTWVTFDGSIGEHSVEQVRWALGRLAHDRLIEQERAAPGRARLLVG